MNVRDVLAGWEEQKLAETMPFWLTYRDDGTAERSATCAGINMYSKLTKLTIHVTGGWFSDAFFASKRTPRCGSTNMSNMKVSDNMWMDLNSFSL